ncbi:Enoyl-(Acyl carrier protein) reductase, partial [Rhizoctonia solani]
MQRLLSRCWLSACANRFRPSFRHSATRYTSAMSHTRHELPLIAIDMNPGWGTPTETLRKVREFAQSEYFINTPPVEGAIEGVKRLKGLGYRLEIVTARALRHQPGTDKWLEKYLPGSLVDANLQWPARIDITHIGVIDKVHYTGEFEHNPNAAVPSPPHDSENPKNTTKADVLKKIGAKALIDDSLPNALLCSEVVPVLLFGEYQWNKRPSLDVTSQDRMSYSERQRWEQVEAKHRAEKNGTELKENDWNEWWERDNLYILPPRIVRAGSWTNVIECSRTRPQTESICSALIHVKTPLDNQSTPNKYSTPRNPTQYVNHRVEGSRPSNLSSKRSASIRPSEERVLIIGASSGVGRATAVAYAKRGARVAITARRSAVLEQVKQECIDALNESGHPSRKDAILAVTADFSDERDMEGVRTAIQRAWNGLDTVVVAAGVSALQPVMNLVNQGGVGRAVTVAVKAIEGNYVGPLVSATTMVRIPFLESTSKKPAIALISSLAAVVPASTRAIYCSTKSAGLLLFQSLAIEHPRIKFSNIIPATIEGDFRASAVDGGDVREVLKGALGREQVAQAIIHAVDTEQRNVWMPRTMRFAPFLYWIWPSFVEKKAMKKYNFTVEG